MNKSLYNASNKTADTAKVTRWFIVTTLVFLNVLNYADRSVLSIAMEAMKADFDFTDAQMGALQTMLLIGVGMLALPVGILIDRWDRKKLLAGMAILWSVATFVTALTRNFLLLLGVRFACGAGESSFHPGGAVWISNLFSKEVRAKLLSLMYVGSFLGSLLGVVLGGYLITLTNEWRTPFYVFGVFGLMFGCLLLLFRDPAPKARKKVTPLLKQEFREIFAVRTFLYTVLGAGFMNVLFLSQMSWMPALLMRGFALDEARLGALIGAAMIPGCLAPLVAGVLADRLQKRFPSGRPLLAAAIVALTGLMAILSFAMVGKVPLPVFMVAFVFFTFVQSMSVVFFQVITMDVTPLRNRGKASSFCVVVMFLIFSWWGSVLVGVVSDAMGGGLSGLRLGLMILTPAPFIGAFFYYMAARHYKNDSEAADKVDAVELDQDE